MKTITKHVLVGCGTFFVTLGVVGIFVPLLPTTVFLLIGAACYARGSQRFYNWLMNHGVLGTMIRDYREGRGIPLPQKLITIAILWVTIASSAYFFVESLWVKGILLVVAVGVTIHLVTIKTRRTDTSPTVEIESSEISPGGSKPE